MECNGQAVNQDLYPDLFALMHNTPNYQGYFLRGVGGNSDRLGVEQGDAIRNIKGEINHGADADGGGKGLLSKGALTYNNKIINSEGNLSWGWDYVGYIKWFPLEFDASRAVPTANENRPINKAVKYIIKAE